MSDSSGDTPADRSIEMTQPHPKHRREGVPYDGAPDLGLYAAALPTAPAAPPPGAGAPAAPDLAAMAEFGEDPDTELAG